MRSAKKQLTSSEEIVKKGVKGRISSRLTKWTMTFVLNIQKFLWKLFILNTYHSAYNTPYIKSYAQFCVTANTKHLKRIKWLYTPKLLLLHGYYTISEELSKIVGNKSVKKRATLVKDIQYNESKLTRLYLSYYILHVKEDEEAYRTLRELGIVAKDREDYIKKALGSIKMVETKQKALLDEFDNKKEEAKAELDDFIQNKMIFFKNGYIGSGDCTVAEYGNASVLWKKEIDRLTQQKNGK